uniref:Membrane protein a155 n=1 Tax=Mastomys natalensis cytomegalovirus 1 TaxID=2973541 RepID=A0A9Y1N5S0_9BETA|nr:membrane protein a155 [Mastomys natalensis cytomegalovirus 1]WEG69004.1 membrane protein a155 [Mastomys natalensis cytomegalovirus 1]WEG71232.1 membrane protein a155 [Mastomys natalensis cytomegalovirus 1]
MRTFFVICSFFLPVSGYYSQSKYDPNRSNLCNPISLWFTNSYKPPDGFMHGVSFDFSFTVLNFTGGDVFYWDPTRRNFSIEHELFTRQQGTLSLLQRRLGSEEVSIDYICHLGMHSPCSFSLESDGITIASGDASQKTYEMPDGKNLNITPFQNGLLYLQKSAAQLQTQWSNTCKRLVDADTVATVNYTFEYYEKSKQIFCKLNASLPILYTVSLTCVGCVPIVASPKRYPWLTTYTARNVTSPSLPASKIMCTITSPTGWNLVLSDYDRIVKTTQPPTTTIFRVTFLDTTFDQMNQAMDSEDPHANLRSGLIGSAVVLLIILAAVLVAFRRLLGIVWLDTFIDRVRTIFSSIPGYLAPRSTSVSTVED